MGVSSVLAEALTSEHHPSYSFPMEGWHQLPGGALYPSRLSIESLVEGSCSLVSNLGSSRDFRSVQSEAEGE